MFSQTSEEKYITEYFGDEVATFLDIGAFHAETFSNTRQLAIQGWGGIMIEPQKDCFRGLEEFYKDRDDITILKYGIHSFTGNPIFYDNPGAVATFNKEHHDKWSTTVDYELTTMRTKTFADFLEENPDTYSFINLDIEGGNFEVLAQIDLNAVGCRLICVEHNQINTESYVTHLVNQGFREIHRNGENLIWGK